jgi:hypothetical protein
VHGSQQRRSRRIHLDKNKSPTGQIMSEWGFVAQRLTGNHWRLARDEMLRLLSGNPYCLEDCGQS